MNAQEIDDETEIQAFCREAYARAKANGSTDRLKALLVDAVSRARGQNPDGSPRRETVEVSEARVEAAKAHFKSRTLYKPPFNDSFLDSIIRSTLDAASLANPEVERLRLELVHAEVKAAAWRGRQEGTALAVEQLDRQLAEARGASKPGAWPIVFEAADWNDGRHLTVRWPDGTETSEVVSPRMDDWLLQNAPPSPDAAPPAGGECCAVCGTVDCKNTPWPRSAMTDGETEELRAYHDLAEAGVDVVLRASHPAASAPPSVRDGGEVERIKKVLLKHLFYDVSAHGWPVGGVDEAAAALASTAPAAGQRDVEQLLVAGNALLYAAETADPGSTEYHSERLPKAIVGWLNAQKRTLSSLRASRAATHPAPKIDSPRDLAAVRAALEREWVGFLDINPDGLTSPEDLPNHALVTCEQMIGIVEAALATLDAAPAPDPASSDADEREEEPCYDLGGPLTPREKFLHGRRQYWMREAHAQHARAEAALAPDPASAGGQDVEVLREPIGFGTALPIVKRGFEIWAAKEHNRRWFRKIDGTPIPNDLCVNIASEVGKQCAALRFTGQDKTAGLT